MMSVEGWEEGRWYIVVLVTPAGKATGALSRRQPGDAGVLSGPWGLLTEDEATELAAAWTADDRDPGEPGTTAQVVEVFRFDGDPGWPEHLS